MLTLRYEVMTESLAVESEERSVTDQSRAENVMVESGKMSVAGQSRVENVMVDSGERSGAGQSRVGNVMVNYNFKIDNLKPYIITIL